MNNIAKKIAVITSGGANFYSIEIALQRLGVDYQLTTDATVINNADAVIFPGVGSAQFAMEKLHNLHLVDVIRNYKKPLLGICLGMQLLYDYSEEGNVACLGIIPGHVKKFAPHDLIVPHMGWNNLHKTQDSKLLNGYDTKQDVYFVHSFYAPVNEFTLASCEYGDKFCAVAQYNNFFAMQFHPEKSGVVGEQLLKNFLGII